MNNFKKVLLTENSIVKSQLGLCAAVAVTTTLWGGLVIGITTLVVLVLDLVILSLLRNSLSEQGIIYASVTFGAGLATVAELVIKALFYNVAMSVGWFIPLIAVSGLLVVFVPSVNDTVGRSAVKGLIAGLAYTLMLVAISVVREILGFASIAGISLGFQPMALIATPFGGFLMLGLIAALVQWLAKSPKEKEEA